MPHVKAKAEILFDVFYGILNGTLVIFDKSVFSPPPLRIKREHPQITKWSCRQNHRQGTDVDQII